MGLKMEYNTRRLVMDDKRELQYRVEVQNRVYRKEISTLDAEIQKLEKLLENNSSSTSSSQVSIMQQQHIKVNIFILKLFLNVLCSFLIEISRKLLSMNRHWKHSVHQKHPDRVFRVHYHLCCCQFYRL
jgi:hypothetical protein